MDEKLWSSQMECTPDGETKMPCFRSLLLASDLAMRGKGCDRLDHRQLFSFLHPVFQIWPSAADFRQGLNATAISGSLIPIERIPGKPYGVASLGDIAQFGGKIEKSRLVLGDTSLKPSIGNAVGMVLR